jgi:holo-[acyl-carrier protein] synthase
MERRDLLLQTVAEFFGTDPSQIGDDFPLAGKPVQSSLAQARFYAAIQQRLGVQGQALYAARTYGELHAVVCGTTASAPAPLPSLSAQRNGQAAPPMHHEMMGFEASMSCGIDIEIVQQLPEAQDYWEEAFYRTSFTSAEIAYCLMQDDPRMHFAARWCAKEALKKCHATYLHEAMANLEVAFTDAGAPFLRHYVNGVSRVLPFAVSISHTPHSAVAIVMPRTQPSEPQRESAEKAAPVEASISQSGRPAFGLAPFAIAFIALVSAVWALSRTF